MKGKLPLWPGRLMSWRKQGGLAFGHVQDQTGRIQLFLKKESVQGLNKETGTLVFPEFNLLDLGDIVEATAKVMKTERGRNLYHDRYRESLFIQPPGNETTSVDPPAQAGSIQYSPPAKGPSKAPKA
jgi:hypothetical protein